MDRPFMDAPIEKIEEMVRDHTSNRVVLAQVREELQFRKNRRARQLLKEVQGLLDGEVPMPARPPRPDDPSNQLPLIR